MSSKLEISVKMPSGPENWEEWKEDDFEDLDPVRSGGEPGAVVDSIISSSNCGVKRRTRMKRAFRASDGGETSYQIFLPPARNDPGERENVI